MPLLQPTIVVAMATNNAATNNILLAFILFNFSCPNVNAFFCKNVASTEKNNYILFYRGELPFIHFAQWHVKFVGGLFDGVVVLFCPILKFRFKISLYLLPRFPFFKFKSIGSICFFVKYLANPLFS